VVFNVWTVEHEPAHAALRFQCILELSAVHVERRGVQHVVMRAFDRMRGEIASNERTPLSPLGPGSYAGPQFLSK